MQVKGQKIPVSRRSSPVTRLDKPDLPFDSDERWMRLALALALKGRFETSPNPIVGACVVLKGKLVGQGWHKRFGGPHAEAMALRQAGKKAKGAVLYVTLEPCSSWGKTPPCVDAIIQSGIREVIFAVQDPNPKHAGRAAALLKKAGVRVRKGLLAREAESQNETFFKWIQTGRPFVTLKMAQTLDGKIATRTGQSRWISSLQSRELVQNLRRSHDAVLVGKNTLLMDNPRLSVRGKDVFRPLRGGKDLHGRDVVDVMSCRPLRVVLDPRCEVPAGAKIFTGTPAVLLAIGEKALKKASLRSWKKPVTLLPLKEIKGRLDLNQLLKKLGALGVASLLVEGGGETAWSFLSQKQVDRVIWITAPKIFGGRGAKTSVEGEGVALPAQALNLKSWTVFPCGSDFVLEGRL
ncbi:MAG: bifunctional diaminohydroxyphosphoribosylaminopyrimidine deaminase/5-amino-6-(5-phosphoribosylamino)uracil reductase RibD [Candidatus Omnitrophica bacterium]|nr:bifunctional diaminohydroxyphosphoribosylaminopyrimidine deaminase/5-amino-6-(5-phosphoribosylamino)uracil reductase RibD [Candidatus Omnitrophota bacterium]